MTEVPPGIFPDSRFRAVCAGLRLAVSLGMLTLRVFAVLALVAGCDSDAELFDPARSSCPDEAAAERDCEALFQEEAGGTDAEFADCVEAATGCLSLIVTTTRPAQYRCEDTCEPN